MSSIPEDLKYTKDHEWIKLEDEFTALCGITDHAQEMLTDIVFVELPEVDLEVNKGEQIAVVESVKAVSDVYSPVTGRILEANVELEDAPELLNQTPNESWIVEIKPATMDDFDSLLSREAYLEILDGE